MPDLSLIETIVAVLAAVGAGSGGVALATRRPAPGTPADHERRVLRLERRDRECAAELTRVGERLALLDGRVTTTETTLATAVGRLTESTDRLWRATDRLNETVDEIRAVVTRLDIEAALEREQRRCKDIPQETQR